MTSIEKFVQHKMMVSDDEIDYSNSHNVYCTCQCCEHILLFRQRVQFIEDWEEYKSEEEVKAYHDSLLKNIEEIKKSQELNND